MVSWVKGALQDQSTHTTTKSKSESKLGMIILPTLWRVMDSVFQIKSASRKEKEGKGKEKKKELHPQFFFLLSFFLSFPKSGLGQKKEREKGFWQKP